MKENVLDVLLYLFENDMFDNGEMEPDQEMLSHELAQAGFDETMIERAFDWLDNLAALCEEPDEAAIDSKPGAVRHYHELEAGQISVEVQGLVLKLEQCGVLSPSAREMVIDRLLALGSEHDPDSMDLEDVKWVILMVLCNFNNGEGISDLTENVVLDGLHSCIH